MRVRAAFRRHSAEPGMKSLTNYQANRIRVEVKRVRRYPIGPNMKSLTISQVNQTRVE